MLKKIIKTNLFLAVFFLLFSFFSNDANALVRIGDLITNSAPGEVSDHTIIFHTTEEIPPSGRIEITPESGYFTIPNGFDYTAIDFEVSSNASGPFVNREIIDIPDNFFDGFAGFLSTTTIGTFVYTLNSSSGIPADSYIQIYLGTNATYSATSSKQIINPITANSYRWYIDVYNPLGDEIEKGQFVTAIIEPISMGSEIRKVRSGGSPTGWLAYGTTQTIMSLYTNYMATCRYADSPGVPYASMSEEFTYSGGTSDLNHTVLLSGLTGGDYEYYVRCMDDFGVSDDTTLCNYRIATTTYIGEEATTTYYYVTTDCVDYEISFSVLTQPGDGGDSSGGDGDDDSGNTGTDDGDSGADSSGGGGGGGGGGSGGGGGGSTGTGSGKKLPYPPPPDTPGVIFEGWTSPGAYVNIMQDGSNLGYAVAGATGKFGAFLEDLDQGVYTFGLYTKDSGSTISSTYSTTFWIDDGTQTTVTDIVMPPTISVTNTEVNAGENIEVWGQAVPEKEVEIWLYPKISGEINEDSITKLNITTGSDGRWIINVGTNQISDGIYMIKAIVKYDENNVSEDSRLIEVKVGEAVEIEETVNICAGADLNQDGKVNITDFSILLYHWGSDNDCADQNDDGTVNITDFSIMMYYWTG